MPNELRPTPTAQGNPTEKLTKVFDTKEESEAMVVYGLLESSGINGVLTSQEASEEVLPGVGHMEIVVPDELAEEARQVIAAYREAPETLETAEPDELIVERPEGPLIRVSTHFYNTEEEIDRLADALPGLLG